MARQGDTRGGEGREETGVHSDGYEKKGKEREKGKKGRSVIGGKESAVKIWTEKVGIEGNARGGRESEGRGVKSDEYEQRRWEEREIREEEEEGGKGEEWRVMNTGER